MDSEPQARAAADARRQPAVPAETEVRGDHGLRSPSAGVSESGATDDADRRRSVVADITYVRLEVEFVYLAVILDAYSRRVIGWDLDSTLEDSLTLAALRMALARRTVTPELVHHSDRGVQYASGEYTQLLKDHHIQISMSRKANPWDNAACESFMKTLKCEEVYRTEDRDQADARLRMGEFIEHIYNEKRLHSALDFRPPAEFERDLRTAQKKEAAARRLIA